MWKFREVSGTEMITDFQPLVAGTQTRVAELLLVRAGPTERAPGTLEKQLMSGLGQRRAQDELALLVGNPTNGVMPKKKKRHKR
jgi:hypothetical protein